MLHVNRMDARHPDRYMVISKQRAENSNEDLKSTLSVDWIDDQKVCMTFWKAKYLGFLCMQKHTLSKFNMPLKEQRVVLHNQVYSSNKLWKIVRARACGLENIKNDWSNNVQGYRCFPNFLLDMVHAQTFFASIQSKS